MNILEELKTARDNTIFKAKLINNHELGVTKGMDLLGEITVELGDVVEKAIVELEKLEED